MLISTASYGGVRNDPHGVTFLPGWRRLGQAALNALTDPQTWVPAAGAAGVYFSGNDQRISDWATTHNPVFGSPQRAADASNYFLDGSAIVYLATDIARFGGLQPSAMLYPASVGLLTGLAAEGGTQGLTELIKAEAGRERPNGSDDLSFPSGHASGAAVSTALACRNIEALDIPRPLQIAMESGATLLTVGTAWGRVEGKRHYLSDVLAGAALGHFVGNFLNDAFLGTNSRAHLDVDVKNSGKNMGVGVTMAVLIGK